MLDLLFFILIIAFVVGYGTRFFVPPQYRPSYNWEWPNWNWRPSYFSSYFSPSYAPSYASSYAPSYAPSYASPPCASFSRPSVVSTPVVVSTPAVHTATGYGTTSRR